MTINKIKAELRRSACEDAFPYSDISNEAFQKAGDFLDFTDDDLFWAFDYEIRTFYLLVAEALE
jgi:hypothetical protein